MTDSQNNTATDDEDLKQDLDEDLSQVVHDYTSRGLPPAEVVDSMIWHAELAVSNSTERTSVEEYTE